MFEAGEHQSKRDQREMDKQCAEITMMMADSASEGGIGWIVIPSIVVAVIIFIVAALCGYDWTP